MITDLRFHPLSKVFPLLEGDGFNSLVADIRKNGLREPILLADGTILDGRNRYRACIAAGIEPRFVEYKGLPDQMAALVVSLNLHRRHLDESQRAMVASRLATLTHGGNRSGNASIDALTQTEAAALLNVSRPSVQRARKVQTDGVAELGDAVDAGAVRVSAAADIASLPTSDQLEIVARGVPEILRVAKEIRAKQAACRRAERLARIETKAATPLDDGRRYAVIYADPPWRFEVRSELGLDRSADNHYPTMPLEDIKSMQVPAADDAVLFLWATAPMMPQALEVMEAWGFVYKSQLVWIKPRSGTGYWFRNRHELLLVGTRGDMPAPMIGTQRDSVLEAPLGRHSEKPLATAEMIESMYPELSRLELFARSLRIGWTGWGNQTPTVEPTAV